MRLICRPASIPVKVAPVDVLGIDISKADFHALLQQGDRSSKRVFPNTKTGFQQLARWLKNRKADDVHVCMESTGAYWLGLAMDLYDRNVHVSVANPAQIKSFARLQLRRTKTDSVDAEIIADFCRKLSPNAWQPPQREVLQIRALLSFRDQLVGERLRYRQLAETMPEADIFLAENERHSADLKTKIKSIETQLRELVAATPNLAEKSRLLRSIPGIGELSAHAIVAHLPMDRLRNSKAAAAYTGLTPCLRQSGTSINGRPRLSKIGNSRLRRALYMPALAATRGKSALADFAARLKAAGKCGKVAVAAVMRKLITIAFAVLKSGQPYNPALQA
jgi:transposase